MTFSKRYEMRLQPESFRVFRCFHLIDLSGNLLVHPSGSGLKLIVKIELCI